MNIFISNGGCLTVKATTSMIRQVAEITTLCCSFLPDSDDSTQEVAMELFKVLRLIVITRNDGSYVRREKG